MHRYYSKQVFYGPARQASSHAPLVTIRSRDALLDVQEIAISLFKKEGIHPYARDYYSA
jgi:hypothetical protein